MINGELDQFDFTADDVRESLIKLLGKWRLGDLVWHLRQRQVLIPAVDRFYGPRWISLVAEEDEQRKRAPKWFVFTLDERFFRMSASPGGYWDNPDRITLEEISDPSILTEMEPDMSFTLDQVKLAVAGIANHPGSWAHFRSELLRKEVVELPGVGWASIVEDNDAEYDSYDDPVGPADFVFKIDDDRHFRKYGIEDSYDNETEWNGALEEVRAAVRPKTIWQAV